MLTMPRRSVTRFFIPLIDVLTLLFCVFLVMPMAKGTVQSAASPVEEENQRLQAELDRLRGLGADEPEKIRKELDELRKAKIEAIKTQIVPRILQIDNSDGQLYVQEADGPVRVDKDKADQLIKDDRQKFGESASIVYVVKYPPVPRKDMNHPTDDDRENYEQLFKGLALIYEGSR